MKAMMCLPVGLLSACGLVLSCSSSSTPGTTSSSGGTQSTSGGAGGASSAGAPSGGKSSGGSSAGGVPGVAPVNGTCSPNSVKHPDGLCYCQPDTLTSCPDGCYDPQSDPDHCGDCSTKCAASATCNAGKCSAAPSTFVPAATGCGSIHLVLSSGTLYWTDQTHGTVQSIATAAGSTAKPVAMGQTSPTLIAVNGTTVYWLTGKSIMKSAAGAAPTPVATSTDDIHGFTLSDDGNTLYYASTTIVNKTPSAGGGAVTEVGHEDTGIPHALSVSGNLIAYPADLTGDVDIMTMVDGTPAACSSDTTTNKNCLRVARSQGSIYLDGMYLLNGNAYWGNQANISTASTTDTSGTNDTVAGGSPDASTLGAFSISNNTVFLADNLGGVYQAPLMVNATAAGIARGQMGVTSIAADTSNVYFATGDCAIMSAPLK